MMRDAALGLHHLHGMKIVHMDVKPLNFFVTEHLQVKVGDFGFAKKLNDNQLQASIVGYICCIAQIRIDCCDSSCVSWWGCHSHTTTHCAPETLSGSCSFPADVYSFALVMFEMMTMRAPWPPEDINAALPSRVAAGLRPILPAGMPADHRSLLEMTWQHDAARRPTMSELIAAIDRLSDVPEQPTPSAAPLPSSLPPLQPQPQVVTPPMIMVPQQMAPVDVAEELKRVALIHPSILYPHSEMYG